MEINVDSSVSSFSSLSSSSSSSFSSFDSTVQTPPSPSPGSRIAIEKLKCIDFVGNGGKEWKDVENRFDQLALVQSGDDEPVLKCSDFGFCLGMQQSPEYAKELLRALRANVHQTNCITKSQLHSYWIHLIHPSLDTRIQIFFHLCDRDMDGRITKMDIKQIILLSASTNKLPLSHEEAEDYATLFMEEVDTEKQGCIKLSQFETLFKVTLLSRRCVVRKQFPIPYHNVTYEEPMSKIEILFRSYWRRIWIVSLWLIICFALFTWKFIQYRRRMEFEVMGYCLCTAKGAAETLKFNMALILLPVCRNTVTWLRKNNHITSIVPFNDNINFHKLIAGGIVVGVILHGGTHLACDFPRISGSDSSIFQQTLAPQFGYHQPSYIQILATTEVATGIIMVLLMVIAFSLATRWPRRQSPLLPRPVRQVTGYNTFWYSHHLFILVYALLIVHSMFLFLTDNLIEKTTWMYIVLPCLLYAGERIYRAIRSEIYEAQVLKASIYTGKVLSLKLRKPEGFRYKSGMYIFLQCPQISQFEWHPFSLTSGPEDDYLSVHVRTLGDWSCQLYTHFQEASLSGSREYPRIHIDGPYGAASQDHVKYDIIMLIGLGIGATPFISILKDVTNGLKNDGHPLTQICSGEYCITKTPSKAYLYWVTKEKSSFDWFRDFMKEISKTNQKQPVIEMHNFLTSVYQEGDARSIIISIIQALYHAKNGIDIVSQTPVRTHFSRPNWLNIFSKMACTHRGERIGVFYCGPSELAKELERLCTKFSTKTTTRFVFHKENY